MLNFEVDNLIEEVEKGIEKEELISKLKALSNQAEWLEQKRYDLIVRNDWFKSIILAITLIAVVGWIL